MNADPCVELLHTLSEVLDIRSVFPRVSAIANQVLPHDCLGLFGRDGEHFTLEARSSDSLPEFRCLAFSQVGEFQIVDDLAREPAPLIGIDPPDFRQRALAAGYRSLLNVRSAVPNHGMGLGFFSKQARSYRESDVPTARSIANYLALAISHEQLAQAERRRDQDARSQRPPLTAASKRAHGAAQLPPIIGQSPAWRRALAQALQVAPTEATALLQGESGTGKEVMAQLIHRHSPRRDGPFVALNCAALPDTLLEAELFGYERGAFTGAQQSKAGQIELAAGGTLFLDEVSELSPLAQAKCLRVLQEREFKRLGGTRSVRADVRVIAATNRDLWQATRERSFREDLYYRLHVFDIGLPALRERPDDIALLTDAFVADLGRELGRPASCVTAEARALLQAHAWPGNVRELRNVLERAVILCAGGRITSEHLGLRRTPVLRSLPTDLDAVEQRRIQDSLEETDWNVAKTAKRLGLTRTQLYVRLRKYQLERPAA